MQKAKKIKVAEEIYRLNQLLLAEKLNVDEEIEDVIHFYCQQHQENGGISKTGWHHAVTLY